METGNPGSVCAALLCCADRMKAFGPGGRVGGRAAALHIGGPMVRPPSGGPAVARRPRAKYGGGQTRVGAYAPRALSGARGAVSYGGCLSAPMQGHGWPERQWQGASCARSGRQERADMKGSQHRLPSSEFRGTAVILETFVGTRPAPHPVAISGRDQRTGPKSWRPGGFSTPEGDVNRPVHELNGTSRLCWTPTAKLDVIARGEQTNRGARFAPGSFSVSRGVLSNVPMHSK